ncbi:hypothetical protein L9F63_020220, partial [Diploptera punctata]
NEILILKIVRLESIQKMASIVRVDEEYVMQFINNDWRDNCKTTAVKYRECCT